MFRFRVGREDLHGEAQSGSETDFSRNRPVSPPARVADPEVPSLTLIIIGGHLKQVCLRNARELYQVLLHPTRHPLLRITRRQLELLVVRGTSPRVGQGLISFFYERPELSVSQSDPGANRCGKMEVIHLDRLWVVPRFQALIGLGDALRAGLKVRSEAVGSEVRSGRE